MLMDTLDRRGNLIVAERVGLAGKSVSASSTGKAPPGKHTRIRFAGFIVLLKVQEGTDKVHVL